MTFLDMPSSVMALKKSAIGSASPSCARCPSSVAKSIPAPVWRPSLLNVSFRLLSAAPHAANASPMLPLRAAM